jgi:hypothetical protein
VRPASDSVTACPRLSAQAVEQWAGARCGNAPCELAPEQLGVARRARDRVAVGFASVRRAYEADHLQLQALEIGVRRDRRVTASVQRPCERALGDESRVRARIVQRCESRLRGRVVVPALDADHALADRRHRDVDAEHLRDVPLETEPLEPCAREQDRIEAPLLQATQPRVDVTAQQLQFEVRTRGSQLCLPARTRRAEARGVRQLPEAAVPQRHERIERIRARQRSGDFEPRRQLARHVLHRMHGEIGAAFLERDFEFLDEEALAADLRERAILDAITLRDHRHELDRERRVRLSQQRRDVLGLP